MLKKRRSSASYLPRDSLPGVFLLADSTPFFKDDSFFLSVLMAELRTGRGGKKKAGEIKACFVAASISDDKNFYDVFLAGMERLGLSAKKLSYDYFRISVGGSRFPLRL